MTEVVISRPFIPVEDFIKHCEKRCQCLPKYEEKLVIRMGANGKEITSIPLNASLKSYIKTIYDQGLLGSCVANATCQVIKMTDFNNTFEPSRLHLYTNTVMYENNGQIVDHGSDAIDACTILRDKGVCEEKFMPYTMDAQSNVLGFGQPPSSAANANALLHKYTGFQNITPQSQLSQTVRTAIANGKPVLLAFFVPSNFTRITSNGIMPMPVDKKILGGHEVVCIGYDQNYIECVNSWGSTWGAKGYFKMPNAFFSALYQGKQLYVMQLVTLRTIAPLTNVSDTQEEVKRQNRKRILSEMETQVTNVLTQIRNLQQE